MPRLQTSRAVSRWPALLSAMAVLGLAVFGGQPARAQGGVNIGKVGKAAGDSIRENAAEGGTINAEAPLPAEEMTPAESAEVAPEAGTSTAGATPPDGETAEKDPNAPPESEKYVLDPYLYAQKISAEEKAAIQKEIMQRVFNFMNYHLDANSIDVRDRQFEGGRYPWISRAPRQNPFDPQIVKPLPFHDLELPTTPPPPYYPPAGGIKQAGLQDAFQAFIDSSRLAGIIETDDRKSAIIIFGKKTAQLSEGDEFTQKEYTVKVRDISKDTVVITTVDGDLSGILSLDLGKNLFVGQGERSLVIISGDEEEGSK